MAKTEEERLAYNREKSARSRAKKLAAMGKEAYKEVRRVEVEAWRGKKKAEKAAVSVAPRVEEAVGDAVPTPLQKRISAAIDRFIEILTQNKALTKDDVVELNGINEKIPDIVDKIDATVSCKDVVIRVVARLKRLHSEGAKKGPSDETMVKYINTIRRLWSYIHDGEEYDCRDWEWVKDTDFVLDQINKMTAGLSVHSGQSYRIALSSVLNHLKGYSEAQKVYSRKSSKVYVEEVATLMASNKLTPAQEKVYVDMDGLRVALAKADVGSRDAVLMSVYIGEGSAPRRILDFSQMKIHKMKDISDEEEAKVAKLDENPALPGDFNWLVVTPYGKPVRFIFRRFKTVKEFKVQTYKVGVEAKKNLVEYLKSARVKDPVTGLKRPLKNKDFLFPNTKGKSFEGGFSTLVSRTFAKYTDSGRGPSVNLLRHAYITEVMSKGLTLATRKLIATSMAHSQATQGTYEVLGKEPEDGLSLVPELW